MFKLFHSMKDKAVNVTAKFVVKSKLERYGKMINLKINSSDKSIYLEIHLKGEEKPVELKIINYKIIQEEEKVFIEIDEIQSSKEWIQIAASDFLTGKKFELPSKFKNTIKMLL